jgi:hypothetical protein
MARLADRIAELRKEIAQIQALNARESNSDTLAQSRFFAAPEYNFSMSATEHVYWAVKCAGCGRDLRFQDLGTHHEGMMPVLPELPETYEITCPALECQKVHKYHRSLVIPVLHHN